MPLPAPTPVRVRRAVPWAAHPSWCRVTGQHLWNEEGGRGCPCGSECHSQPAYRCLRCGAYDYGDPGGPGWEDTLQSCPFGGDEKKREAAEAEEEAFERGEEMRPAEPAPLLPQLDWEPTTCSRCLDVHRPGECKLDQKLAFPRCSCGGPLPAGRVKCPHCEHLERTGGRR